MVVKKSGICKNENCDKLQVRDGFCQQCSQHYLQKTIISKLDDVSTELAKIKTVDSRVPQTNDNTLLLIQVLSQQTELLQGVISEIRGLKSGFINQPSQVNHPSKLTKLNIDDEQIFIPSINSINISNDANIVEDGKETTNVTKNLNDIANKLNSFKI